MKKILILLLFTTKVIAQQNENFLYFDAKVEGFYKINDTISKTQIKIDTNVTSFYRQIILAKNGSEFGIGFPIDDDTVFINYKVEKIDKIIHQSNNKEYTYYLGFDENKYPMILYISNDNNDAMFYYYYTSTIKSFCKSERMLLTLKNNKNETN